MEEERLEPKGGERDKDPEAQSRKGSPSPEREAHRLMCTPAQACGLPRRSAQTSLLMKFMFPKGGAELKLL